MKEPKYAGFWIRLLAAKLKSNLLLVPSVWLLAEALKQPTIPELFVSLFSLLLYILFPTGLLITVLPLWLWAGDPGHLLTGLRVTDEKGKRLTFKRILFRETVGAVFSSLLFGAGYIAIAKDAKKQGWHDKAVGSLVVVQQTLWPLALLLFTCLFILNIILLKDGIQAFIQGPLPKAFQEVFMPKQENKVYPVVQEGIDYETMKGL